MIKITLDNFALTEQPVYSEPSCCFISYTLFVKEFFSHKSFFWQNIPMNSRNGQSFQLSNVGIRRYANEQWEQLNSCQFHFTFCSISAPIMRKILSKCRTIVTVVSSTYRINQPSSLCYLNMTSVNLLCSFTNGYGIDIRYERTVDLFPCCLEVIISLESTTLQYIVNVLMSLPSFRRKHLMSANMWFTRNCDAWTRIPKSCWTDMFKTS